MKYQRPVDLYHHIPYDSFSIQHASLLNRFQQLVTKCYNLKIEIGNQFREDSSSLKDDSSPLKDDSSPLKEEYTRRITAIIADTVLIKISIMHHELTRLNMNNNPIIESMIADAIVYASDVIRAK